MTQLQSRPGGFVIGGLVSLQVSIVLRTRRRLNLYRTLGETNLNQEQINNSPSSCHNLILCDLCLAHPYHWGLQETQSTAMKLNGDAAGTNQILVVSCVVAMSSAISCDVLAN